MSPQDPHWSVERFLRWRGRVWRMLLWWAVQRVVSWLAFAFLLFVIAVGLRGILLCGTFQEALPFLVMIPLLTALAVLLARRCLWGKPRGLSVSFVELPPDTEDGDEGGRPPDAPRPAPLLPNKPRVLSAKAELQHEETQRVAAVALEVPKELKEMLREALEPRTSHPLLRTSS